MEQSALWNGTVGDPWVRHEQFIDVHSERFEQATLEALGSVDGAAVLDVGCGTGLSALRIAGVGAATVLGVDLSAPMIAHARRRVSLELADRVRFEIADVTTFQPRHDERFDVIFSRFGVMFFADPVAGFTALRRLVRTGARLGFCAWTDPFTNPWMSVPVMASAAVLGPPRLPGPDEPGPFSLGSEERVRAVLDASGWESVSVTLTTVEDHPFSTESASATADVMIETNPVLAMGLETAPEKAGDLRAAVTQALTPYEIDGRVRMSAAALVVTASS